MGVEVLTNGGSIIVMVVRFSFGGLYISSVWSVILNPQGGAVSEFESVSFLLGTGDF